MQSMPNLPTDNLYKFSFLGGLSIVILSCFIYIKQDNLIKEKSDGILLDIVQINTENGFLKEDLIQLGKETTELQSETKKVIHPKRDMMQYYSDLKVNLNDKNYRDYIAFIFEYKDEIFPESAQFNKLVVKTEQYKVKNNQLIPNSEIVSEKRKQLLREFEYRDSLIWVMFIFNLIGTFIALIGRKGWVKFQKIADEKNEIELAILKNQFEKMESDEQSHSVNPS